MVLGVLLVVGFGSWLIRRAICVLSGALHPGLVLDGWCREPGREPETNSPWVAVW